MTDFPDETILNTEMEEEHRNCRMYFNRALNVYGNKIGAIMVPPIGAHFSVAIK